MNNPMYELEDCKIIFYHLHPYENVDLIIKTLYLHGLIVKPSIQKMRTFDDLMVLDVF